MQRIVPPSLNRKGAKKRKGKALHFFIQQKTMLIIQIIGTSILVCALCHAVCQTWAKSQERYERHKDLY
jgi:hypothetical protein